MTDAPAETRAPLPSLRVRRRHERQSEDEADLRALLAEGFVAHVGFLRDGWPVVLPFLYGVGDLGAGPVLLLHGSTGGGLFLDAGPAGIEVSATVTHLDGLVFARSTHDSSANYRSAMIVGRASVVPKEQRDEALWQVADHLMPGRRDEVREMTRKEVRQTQVLQLPLDHASVKIRFQGLGDHPEDGEDHSSWAGVLPLALRAGAPIPGPTAVGIDLSPSVRRLADRLDSFAGARAELLTRLLNSTTAS